MENILEKLKKELNSAETAAAVTVVWKKYLGKEGLVKAQLKQLGQLDVAEKQKQGPLIQAAAKQAQELCDARQIELESQISDKQLLAAGESLGYDQAKLGHLHPVSLTVRHLNELFHYLGYSVLEEREIETDEFCFQRLNVPTNHPARDMQDTIYLQEPNILLRTQTSSIEARVLASFKPPFKVVCPGRSYRNEKVNKSNHFIFHQYQGFVVLPQTSLKDLFGTFTYLFKAMYGDDVVIRYRNKYYPEVEPCAGLDIQCFSCHGRGCPLCKGVGWIEMGGSGLIHPKVLQMAKIDPKKWMGFAFGLGLDRWVMAKYGLTDIRSLLGGELAYKYYDHENVI